LNYLIVGNGRMGRAIDAQAAERGHQRVGLVEGRSAREDDSALSPRQVAGADVAFEFTVPAAAEANVAALLGAGVPTVCGTTGWQPSPQLLDLIAKAQAGLVLAPNFSLGMNLFFRIVKDASRRSGALGLYDPYIEEVHHRGKRDVPSGTARRLADLLLESDPRLTEVREGHPDGALPVGTLQVVGIRSGSDPGTHTVVFDGAQDVITLSHRARGREGFALGAILAAEWLGTRRGSHTFDSVLDEILEGERTQEA
jgi:4-hydroxy-tetrahydrodipicolinate reductase